MPNDGARDLPDVSLFAADGLNLSYYPICAADGDCQPVSGGSTVQVSVGDGTSAAAPSFAGMMALVDQLYGPQGQADYVLYTLAAQYPQAFHDITVGTNTVPCDFTDATPDCIAVSNPLTDTNSGVTEGEIGTGTTADYNAGPGYDLASGLGSVDAYQMVNNWSKVKFAGTTTTLAASQTTFKHGTPITLSGTVTAASGTPTGAVAIESDNTDANKQGLGVFSLSGGAYSGTSAGLPGGSYNLWAAYSGDTVNASSSSTQVPITVTPEASTTQMSVVDSTGAPVKPGTTNIPYGALEADAQSLPTAYYTQCIVSLSPPATCSNGYGYPTGSVTFTDNGTAINTAVIDARGDAEYNGAFGVGNHSLVAKYAGDNSYDASSSPAETFSVVRAVPTIGVYSPSQLLIPGDYWAGGAIQFEIEVTNDGSENALSPSGTITLTGLPGGVPLTCTLIPEVNPYANGAEGTCDLTLPSSVTAGSYNLTIKYSGDANYKPVTSPQPTKILTPFGPTAGLTSTITASISGNLLPTSSGIIISGTVTGQPGQPAPTDAKGGVSIWAEGAGVAFAGFSSSTGDTSSFSIAVNGSELNPGSNQLVVQYAGDSVYSASTLVLSTIVNDPQYADFSVQTATPLVPVTAGKSGTANIQLRSQWGFAGPVTLSCGAAVGVTCTIPATATLTSDGSATVALTISAGADTANLSYSVPITATDSTGTFVHTLSVRAVVTGSPAGTKSFFLDPSLSGLSLASGVGPGTGTTISVWPLGGYTGTVSLKCTVSATGKAVAPACSLSNTSLSLSGTTPQTTFLNISSDGTTARNGPGPLGWLAAGGSALAVLLCFAVPRRRRGWLALVALLAVVIGVGGLGCGDNGPTVQAASVGTYTVTVTGTSGSVTVTTSVTVDVGPS